jgi:selenocysteine-specific elongation factor
MKHLIMGTAGHIDHGKTALIKALTQIDCDTHKEEKKRGITINLGFAHMQLPTGESIGIVDVPGHKDFVHTMVGGASGIDFVLMVIAADSGVMPQTREHLQIMEVLGVSNGLVALTKSDLVKDPDLLKLVVEDVGDFVSGTFLHNAPIVEVSAKTGAGLENLRGKIAETITKVGEKSSKGIFRLYIDRVFSVSGFGTVVTGSVLEGRLNVKDRVYHLPGKERELIVRRLERHGEEVDEVVAGDRASINITGLDIADVSKGNLISDRYLNETAMFDAKLKLFPQSRALKIWSQIIFHSGTFESQARIHLIDKNQLRGGEEGLVQVHLSVPSVLKHGDRFVIRNSSSDVTLGGGEVFDVRPLHHRRRPQKLIKSLSYIAGGSLRRLISAEVKKNRGAIFIGDLAHRLNVSTDEIEEVLKEKDLKEIHRFDHNDTSLLISRQQYQALRQEVIRKIREFHTANPLIRRGIRLMELTGGLSLPPRQATEEIIVMILGEQTKAGNLVEEDKTWKLAGQTLSAEKELNNHLLFFEGYLKSYGMKTPLMSQLVDEAEKRGLSKRQLKQILYHLSTTGKAYKIGGEYLHAGVVNSSRETLIKTASALSDGFTVAQFRDLVKGNRKICLLMLAQFDSEGLTRRQGDLRFITVKK